VSLAVALQDAVNVRIVNNTITRNDSVATGSRAFGASVNQSIPQPGVGVVSRTHSPPLAGIVGGVSINGLPQQNFSNPVIRNSIVRENRMFYWQINPSADQTNCLLNTGGQTCYGLVPNIAGGQAPVFSDLAVIGGAYQLTATYSILTSLAGVSGDASNQTSDPLFRCTYYNGGRDAVIQVPETTAMVTAAAFDEGGNFIDARFGPLTLLNPVSLAPYGDYRILNGSPANDSALAFAGLTALERDRIGVPRLTAWSRGAFEGAQSVPVCGP
jgi:large repetitive protein